MSTKNVGPAVQFQILYWNICEIYHHFSKPFCIIYRLTTRGVLRIFSGGVKFFFFPRGLSTYCGLKPHGIHRFYWSRGGLVPITPPLCRLQQWPRNVPEIFVLSSDPPEFVPDLRSSGWAWDWMTPAPRPYEPGSLS